MKVPITEINFVSESLLIEEATILEMDDFITENGIISADPPLVFNNRITIIPEPNTPVEKLEAFSKAFADAFQLKELTIFNPEEG